MGDGYENEERCVTVSVPWACPWRRGCACGRGEGEMCGKGEGCGKQKGGGGEERGSRKGGEQRPTAIGSRTSRRLRRDGDGSSDESGDGG